MIRAFESFILKNYPLLMLFVVALGLGFQNIADIFQPDKGKVSKNGKLAPILQISGGFNLELKPSENIVLYGMLLGVPKSEIKRKIPYILEFAELEKFSTMKLKHFSSGMLARLSFSTVLQINPDIFLFDEILSVGDLKFKEKVLNTFPSFKEKNKTVLYSTHNLGSLVTLCDRVLLLHHGKQIMIDKPKKVVQKYRELVGIEK